MKAYRSGKLKLEQGMVTYWANGLQLCEPRPSSWDEFDEFADKYGADQEKLWVEQVSCQRSIFFSSLHPGLWLSIIAGRTTSHSPAYRNSASSSF